MNFVSSDLDWSERDILFPSKVILSYFMSPKTWCCFRGKTSAPQTKMSCFKTSLEKESYSFEAFILRIRIWPPFVFVLEYHTITPMFKRTTKINLGQIIRAAGAYRIFMVSSFLHPTWMEMLGKKVGHFGEKGGKLWFKGGTFWGKRLEILWKKTRIPYNAPTVGKSSILFASICHRRCGILWRKVAFFVDVFGKRSCYAYPAPCWRRPHVFFWYLCPTNIHNVCARWAPTSHKWGSNPYKWCYMWVAGVKKTYL